MNPPPTLSATDARTAPKRRVGLVVVSLLMLFISAAMMVGGYLLWRNAVQLRAQTAPPLAQVNTAPPVAAPIADTPTTSTRDASLATRLAAVESTLADIERIGGQQLAELRGELRGELRAEKNALRENESQLRIEVHSLASSLSAARAQFSGQLDQLRVREAEQLLIIANYRLTLTGDARLARAALQLAAERLRPLPAPEWIAVRQLLADEIDALDARADDGLALTLTSLSELSRELTHLPLAGDASDAHNQSDNESNNPTSEADKQAPPLEQTSPHATQESASTDSSMWRAVNTVLADIKAMVQIETEGAPIAPLLSVELRWVMVEKARLMLEGAQLALLREQHDAYGARLADAHHWVGAQFAADSKRVRNWLARLDALKSATPKPTPDISASLRALREAAKAVR